LLGFNDPGHDLIKREAIQRDGLFVLPALARRLRTIFLAFHRRILPQKKLKLFIVGESSGDPNEWNTRTVARAIVIARTPEEASNIAEFSTMAIEIPFDEPKLLMMQTF